MSFIIKTLLSSVLIAVSTEIAKRNPGLGGIILALPLTSMIAFIFMGAQGADPHSLSEYAKSMFIFVPISLVFFLPFIIPMTQNWNFSLKFFLGFFTLVLLNFILIKTKIINL